MPQISHITSYPVDYTQRKTSASLLNLPSLRTFLLVAYFEVLFGGFHFASNTRGKGKLECDHGLKLAQGLVLWLSKTLINGLNFKWVTNKTVSHASIEVCALGVLLKEDIMTLLSGGRRIVCVKYICHQSRCIGKELQTKRVSWWARNEFQTLKLQWPSSKLNISPFS